ncbi:Nif3-like dinuclear metal center hexameric protein [Geopsychrobacter electrodiphilus]|uniref:Nif3-like dinuclear metal center hexameric protein n=1 Tax=Geopsychrobacter electrodiphilus TaxID=225196 RepID=UPI0003616FBB|nr:Nif3-like dinuclear metal center hexameric protein [Geopsychrobacter electrodiphilus]
MAKSKIIRVQDIGGLLNRLYPQALADDWDNVGLQLGDSATAVERVLVCLDVEEKVILRAEELGAQLVISHHPLIYKPLKRIAPIDEPGRTIFRALRQGVSVISAHTNLDRARGGLNDWLATRVGLRQVTPLEQGVGNLLKLVVFVPCGHEEAVKDALFSAGAGEIGAYDRVSFQSKGHGGFRCGTETTPFIGTPGEQEAVDEVRVETVLPAALASKVVAKLLKVHPYEEVAFDLYPLVNQRSDVGLGRIGQLPEALQLNEFIIKIKQALDVKHLRMAGPADKLIKKVAVCGGSGASLISEALRQGADCLLTGDVKYHDAQRARAEGLVLIDAGHFGTEILMVKHLSERLRRAATDQQWALEIIEMTGEEDPFQWI